MSCFLRHSVDARQSLSIARPLIRCSTASDVQSRYDEVYSLQCRSVRRYTNRHGPNAENIFLRLPVRWDDRSETWFKTFCWSITCQTLVLDKSLRLLCLSERQSDPLCSLFYRLLQALRRFAVISGIEKREMWWINEQTSRTELVSDEWTALDRRETKKKSVALDALCLQSRRTPLLLTQLLHRTH